MRWLLGIPAGPAVIGGGMKAADMQLPVIDYPLGGPMQQPQIQVEPPNLNVP